MKLFAGGPQDLIDARQVFKSAATLYPALLRRLAARFGEATLRELEHLLGDG